MQPGEKPRYTYKTQPFSHQKKALNKVFKRDGVAGLFMEMGTGKTKVAIDWAGIGYHNYGVKRVLVAAPLSVIPVWSMQIKAHSPVPTKVIDVSSMSTRSRIAMLYAAEKYSKKYPDRQVWILINYEGLWREGKRTSVPDRLIAFAPDLMICDESHRIKSATARQSKAAYKIGRSARHRLILTGTPITKNPLDLFGQFRFLDPGIFHPYGKNWSKFSHRYAIFGGFGGFQIKGYKNLQELVTRTRESSYRVKKADCLDLPEKLFQDIEVTLSPRERKYYDEMAEQMIIEIEETNATAAIVLVKLLRLSQITSGFVKDIEGNIRVFGDTKLKTTIDLLEDILEEGQKVVIFTRFRTDIQRLSETIRKRFDIAPLILSGSVPGDQRNSIVQRFAKDEHPVFISQIQAGSLGIDLTPASVAIFYSVDYNAANYWQAQDRLHRQGQTKAVTYYNIIAKDTVDREVFQALAEKSNLAERIIHDTSLLRGESHH